MKGVYMAYQEDMDCIAFSNLLNTKEPHYPYSDRYNSEVHRSQDEAEPTEKEHMVNWFKNNPTNGSRSYSRQNPNNSAKKCFFRLANAASLLWIAEAAGIDEPTVAKAFEAAKQAGNVQGSCKAIRDIISWSMIMQAIQH